jgi:lipopolysaccharide export system protein LptC
MDVNGARQYVLEAERMVHFPDDDTALLDKPHVIQYVPERAPTHIYSETGWISSDGDEVILTGNVRVIRGRDSDSSGGVTTTDKLDIVLKEPIS